MTKTPKHKLDPASARAAAAVGGRKKAAPAGRHSVKTRAAVSPGRPGLVAEAMELQGDVVTPEATPVEAPTGDEAARWLAGEVQPPAELPPLITTPIEKSTAYIADQSLAVDVEDDEPGTVNDAELTADDTVDVDFAAVVDAVEEAAESATESFAEPAPTGEGDSWAPSLDFIVEPSPEVDAEEAESAAETGPIDEPAGVEESDIPTGVLAGLTFADEEAQEPATATTAAVVAEPEVKDIAAVEAAALAREVHIHHHYTAPPVPVAPALPAQVYVIEGPPTPQQPFLAIETVPAGTDETSDYVDYGAAQKLPTRTDPGPIAPPAKEPLFAWRGQPIGGDKTATGSTPVTRPAQPKPQPPKRKKRPRQEGDIDGTNVDPQTWFENVVQESLRLGVSDLHIAVSVDETETDTLTARIRIDGQMREYQSIYGMDARVIINKFKAAADLSSAGSYVPEESIYEVQVDGATRKARIALFRTANGGDALVLRLPPTGPIRRLEDLEFAPSNLSLLHELLRSANRMILIAGPMGSGKTTTAHAALAHIATPNRSVWSVEDPVERDLPGLTQLEVDEANGAGFAALLPFLVRSDYDTLFLGEIRDRATAAAGVRQAKAGRQVITTIHANDNVTALLRLIELAEDTPLSVLDAVLGVVSQRLVRRLNPEWDGVDPDTKYRGRIPIHEVLRVNDELVEAVMRDKPIAEIKRIAAELSESTFLKDAARLVDAGITDQAEVDLVLGH